MINRIHGVVIFISLQFTGIHEQTTSTDVIRPDDGIDYLSLLIFQFFLFIEMP